MLLTHVLMYPHVVVYNDRLFGLQRQCVHSHHTLFKLKSHQHMLARETSQFGGSVIASSKQREGRHRVWAGRSRCVWIRSHRQTVHERDELSALEWTVWRSVDWSGRVWHGSRCNVCFFREVRHGNMKVNVGACGLSHTQLRQSSFTPGLNVCLVWPLVVRKGGAFDLETIWIMGTFTLSGHVSL